MSPNRRSVLSVILAVGVAQTVLAQTAPALASPAIGKPAPAFSTVDAEGRTRSLAEFKGKTVVLEWHNDGCPYVKKHYSSGAMQKLQRQATAEGVVWLTVVSSAPGAQGYLTPQAAKGWIARNHAASTALLLDPAGKVGHAYDARATPHMYVIDKAGKLAYMGAIDDKPVADPASLKGAKNYVSAALADLQAGRPVATPATRAYGCSVKYAT